MVSINVWDAYFWSETVIQAPLILIADLDVRVLSEERELLRHLTLDHRGLPAPRRGSVS
jgi:hypothetical protein